MCRKRMSLRLRCSEHMNYKEVNDLEYTEDEMKDFYYTAVRMNTPVDYKVMREMSDSGLISSHRQLYELADMPAEYIDDYKISDNARKKIHEWIENKGKVEKACEGYMNTASQNGVFVLSVHSKWYPVNFRMLGGMPNVIYCKGRKDLIRKASNQGTVAMVGSRNASSYALYATESYSRDLSLRGITVVSGMALGVDRTAHLAALEGDGSTIAVLAGGPDNIYPPDNRDLYRRIVESGLILSEMPPGQQPLRQYFPSRNRLIAGLSDCTLVMEAGEYSGTLHTASFAAAQGKEVFVLPNNIYCENAVGGLRLLEDGCCVLYSIDNVIDSVSQAILCRKMEFPEFRDEEVEAAPVMDIRQADKNKLAELRVKASKVPDEVTEDEWGLLIEDKLSVRPLDIDSLSGLLGLPFYRLSELLVGLQLTGRVVLENGKYALTFF